MDRQPMKTKRITDLTNRNYLDSLKIRKRFTSGCIEEPEKLEVFLLQEMLSCEEEASEISNEFSLEEGALTRKPISLSNHNTNNLKSVSEKAYCSTRKGTLSVHSKLTQNRSGEYSSASSSSPIKMRSTLEKDPFRISSCKNILSPPSINLHNARIIEEDFHENDGDDIMLRLEENKFSIKDNSLGSENDSFFERDEKESSEGTPRFEHHNLLTLTFEKKDDEIEDEEKVNDPEFPLASSFSIKDLKTPESYVKYISQQT